MATREQYAVLHPTFNELHLSNTKTKEGLVVTVVIDKNICPVGMKVTDEEMSRLHIVRNEFHGGWNCTIKLFFPVFEPRHADSPASPRRIGASASSELEQNRVS